MTAPTYNYKTRPPRSQHAPLPIFREQLEIEADDGRRDQPGPPFEPQRVGETAHLRAVAGEPDERDDREGKLHAEHDLAQHEQLGGAARSEEHTSALQSLMRISYAVFCLTKKTNKE